MFPLMSESLIRQEGALMIEGVALDAIAAQFGTPTYVYSKGALAAASSAWQQALAGRRALVCYADKATSNLGILSVFARLGAGFDIVSGGELARVLAAGGRADKVVFSGVGKTRAEMRQALQAGIRFFNVDSAAELEVSAATEALSRLAESWCPVLAGRYCAAAATCGCAAVPGRMRAPSAICTATRGLPGPSACRSLSSTPSSACLRSVA